MKDGEEEKRWVLCPWCGSKTRLQILWETELVTFPLFCPKCMTIEYSGSFEAVSFMRVRIVSTVTEVLLS